MVLVVAVLVVNFLVDLLYAVLDPRLRAGRMSTVPGSGPRARPGRNRATGGRGPRRRPLGASLVVGGSSWR